LGRGFGLIAAAPLRTAAAGVDAAAAAAGNWNDPGYYLQQHIRMGFFKAQNELSQLDDPAGHEALDKCKRMIFWEKGKPEPAN
jgi:hypothetical protein